MANGPNPATPTEPASADEPPVSPITSPARAATFPRPSSSSNPATAAAGSGTDGGATRLSLATAPSDLGTRAGVPDVKPLNEEPLELDSTPVTASMRRAATAPSSSSAGVPFAPGLEVDEEVWREYGDDGEDGEGGGGGGRREGWREKRAALLSSRKTDPAVLVDIPQGPGAEELAVAVAAEAGSAAGPERVVDMDVKTDTDMASQKESAGGDG